MCTCGSQTILVGPSKCADIKAGNLNVRNRDRHYLTFDDLSYSPNATVQGMFWPLWDTKRWETVPVLYKTKSLDDTKPNTNPNPKLTKY